MKIKWLGHACFLLTSAEGTKVLTDPYNEKMGYPAQKVKADIVTVSHGHGDHNNLAMAEGKYQLVDQPGHYTIKDADIDDVDIVGVPTFHDDAGGAKRGRNIIFKITMDDVSVCHCGDLGHPLLLEQAREIGRVDVLLVPVDAFFTMDARTAATVARQLKPTVTIPMHYRTEALAMPGRERLDTEDKFVAEMGGARRPGRQEIELTPESLRDWAGVVVLDYRQSSI